MPVDKSVLASLEQAKARVDGACNRLARLANDFAQMRMYVQIEAQPLFDNRVKAILDAVEDLGMKT